MVFVLSGGAGDKRVTSAQPFAATSASARAEAERLYRPYFFSFSYSVDGAMPSAFAA
jgi:hypothetical protein